MYITPFWCGVITTILVEVVILAIYIIYLTREEKIKDGKNNDDQSN